MLQSLNTLSNPNFFFEYRSRPCSNLKIIAEACYSWVRNQRGILIIEGLEHYVKSNKRVVEISVCVGGGGGGGGGGF